MYKNPSFIPFEWSNGMLYNDSSSDCPSKFHALVGDSTFVFNKGSSYYIFQYHGMSYIKSDIPLKRNHFAVCTENDMFLHGDAYCKALIVERIGTEASFLMGGPIESKGRLKYIDGCTDSLLIAPWKYGEPCLNHLHFPPYINQTPHTHPSIRIGLVAKGYGECITPFGNIPLKEGMLFAILPENGKKRRAGDGKEYPEGTHSFMTMDASMDVIAYHPDSDYGPKDEEHPMINKTIVRGVSAKHLQNIRTK